MYIHMCIYVYIYIYIYICPTLASFHGGAASAAARTLASCRSR